jgi:predicted HAD superfamily Cof-like phosphohydrolase
MNILLQYVREMHKKFNILPEQVDYSYAEDSFRIASMAEELDEYKTSRKKADKLDALIDLIVFALTTVDRQGMSDIFDEAFKRVMEANLAKEQGGNAKRGNFQLDLVKPEGWKAPNFDDLIEGE